MPSPGMTSGEAVRHALRAQPTVRRVHPAGTTKTVLPSGRADHVLRVAKALALRTAPLPLDARAVIVLHAALEEIGPHHGGGRETKAVRKTPLSATVVPNVPSGNAPAVKIVPHVRFGLPGIRPPVPEGIVPFDLRGIVLFAQAGTVRIVPQAIVPRGPTATVHSARVLTALFPRKAIAVPAATVRPAPAVTVHFDPQATVRSVPAATAPSVLVGIVPSALVGIVPSAPVVTVPFVPQGIVRRGVGRVVLNVPVATGRKVAQAGVLRLAVLAAAGAFRGVPERGLVAGAKALAGVAAGPIVRLVRPASLARRMKHERSVRGAHPPCGRH